VITDTVLLTENAGHPIVVSAALELFDEISKEARLLEFITHIADSFEALHVDAGVDFRRAAET
jgi:predicted ATPase